MRTPTPLLATHANVTRARGKRVRPLELAGRKRIGMFERTKPSLPIAGRMPQAGRFW
jgi:hypothetical protein